MKIVIADDDVLARELLLSALEDDGHQVQEACDGEQAASFLAEGDAAVLITDWEMPGKTGPELCRWVRRTDLGRYIYVIMLTSRESRGDLLSGLEAGADDFLTKPFDPVELTIRLRAAQRIAALETRDLVIFSMARLVESRDEDTGHHLERVRAYCRTLGNALLGVDGLGEHVDAEFVRLLYQTSPLHDIGKVGVPDSVLLKQGRLSDSEFALMKRHTIIGAETLADALRHYPNATFLRMALQVARSHHERFDGRGYPDGLSGQDIPLAARILALADVYDALRSRRAYKPPMSHEQAAGIIREGRGTHFDPAIADAFERCGTLFRSIADRLADPETPASLVA